MQVAETTRLYTAEEYSQMPDNGTLTELINGEIVQLAFPDTDHSRLSGWIFALFAHVVVPNDLGILTTEQGAYLLSQNPDTVRAPDVGFMRWERAKKVGLYYKGAPDLAVEVVSPGNSPSDLRAKMDEYFDAGAQAVWLAYWRLSKLDVFTPLGSTTYRMGDTVDVSIIQPGFVLSVEQIFSILMRKKNS